MSQPPAWFLGYFGGGKGKGKGEKIARFCTKMPKIPRNSEDPPLRAEDVYLTRFHRDFGGFVAIALEPTVWLPPGPVRNRPYQLYEGGEPKPFNLHRKQDLRPAGGGGGWVGAEKIRGFRELGGSGSGPVVGKSTIPPYSFA